METYGLSKETVSALQKHENNGFLTGWRHQLFDIVAAGVFQENRLVSYLFILCIDYVHRTSIILIKENGLTFKKARSRRYPVETIIDEDYAGDLALHQSKQNPYCMA